MGSVSEKISVLEKSSVMFHRLLLLTGHSRTDGRQRRRRRRRERLLQRTSVENLPIVNVLHGQAKLHEEVADGGLAEPAAEAFLRLDAPGEVPPVS